MRFLVRRHGRLTSSATPSLRSTTSGSERSFPTPSFRGEFGSQSLEFPAWLSTQSALTKLHSSYRSLPSSCGVFTTPVQRSRTLRRTLPLLPTIFALRDEIVGSWRTPFTAARPPWLLSCLEPTSPNPAKIYHRALPQIKPCSTCITLRKIPRRILFDHSIALRLTTEPTAPQPLSMVTAPCQCHRHPTLVWPTEGRDIELLSVARSSMVQEARRTPKVCSHGSQRTQTWNTNPRVLRHLARAMQVL